MATSKRQTVKSMLRQSYEARVKPRIRMQADKPEMNLDAHSSGHQFDKTKVKRAGVKLANDTQVGGTHYKEQKLQPWDAIAAWDCGFLDGNVIKYVVRYRSKGGVEDLKKARHYLDKLIELEELK